MRGDQRALQQLWALRKETGHGFVPQVRHGFLVVPYCENYEDWAEMIYKQQAKFRDASYLTPGMNAPGPFGARKSAGSDPSG